MEAENSDLLKRFITDQPLRFTCDDQENYISINYIHKILSNFVLNRRNNLVENEDRLYLK